VSAEAVTTNVIRARVIVAGTRECVVGEEAGMLDTIVRRASVTVVAIDGAIALTEAAGRVRA
jgi:hypothetical protein